MKKIVVELPKFRNHSISWGSLFELPENASTCKISFIDEFGEPIYEEEFEAEKLCRLCCFGAAIRSKILPSQYEEGSSVVDGTCFNFNDTKIQAICFDFKDGNGNDCGHANFGVGKEYTPTVLGDVWVSCECRHLGLFNKKLTHFGIDF